jgi:hypothetical protein
MSWKIEISWMLWLAAVEAISARFGSGTALLELVQADEQRLWESPAGRGVRGLVGVVEQF